MRRLATIAILLLVAAACGLPADVSDEFEIELDDRQLVLTIGDTVRLDANLTRNGSSVGGYAFDFSSSAPTIADVTEDGRVRGVSVGQAEISVRAVGLANTPSASRSIRVLRAVAIEAVRPLVTDTPDGRTVRWGELVEITGVGLDPSGLNLIFVSDTPAPIHSFVPAPPGDETASDTLRIWVPARVPAQSSILLSRRGGSTAAWPLTVLEEDVYEPNDTSFFSLDVPAGGLDARGLALEVRPWSDGQTRCWSSFGVTSDDLCWSDGYRIPASSAPLTIVVDLKGTPLASVPLSVELRDGGPGEWMISNTLSICYDPTGQFAFFSIVDHLFDGTGDSLVFALQDVDVPAQLSLTLFGEESGLDLAAPQSSPETLPYDLRVYREHRTSLPPDSREENDYCTLAQPLSIPTSVLELNWDHGHDLDWFSLEIPGTPPDSAAVAQIAESEPNDLFTTADSISFGTRVSGVIDGGADTYTFDATAGDWIDLEIRAERDGDSSLNSVLQLFFGSAQIGLNDDFSTTTFDSRITMRAPGTGTYHAIVADVNNSSRASNTYELDLRKLDSESQFLDMSIDPIVDPEGSATFEPIIQIYRDDRATDGNTNLLFEEPFELSTVLPPGPYLVLVFNRKAQPLEYRLILETRPLS